MPFCGTSKRIDDERKHMRKREMLGMLGAGCGGLVLEVYLFGSEREVSRSGTETNPRRNGDAHLVIQEGLY